MVPTSPEDGYAEIVRRLLWTFGPVTEADLVWWLGSTKSSVRTALADPSVAAIEVGLDSGSTGWVLPDDTADLESPAEMSPWVALLPTLDPTTMGWREREFYLDPVHTPFLFDRAGNGGSTVWVDGRIVGCWVQDPDAVVRLVLREDVGAPCAAALSREAERLTAWLDGEIVNSVYASGQMREARLP